MFPRGRPTPRPPPLPLVAATGKQPNYIRLCYYFQAGALIRIRILSAGPDPDPAQEHQDVSQSC